MMNAPTPITAPEVCGLDIGKLEECAQSQPSAETGTHIPSSPDICASLEKSWRCFQCNAVFTDERAAAGHFGRWSHNPPACMASEGFQSLRTAYNLLEIDFYAMKAERDAIAKPVKADQPSDTTEPSDRTREELQTALLQMQLRASELLGAAQEVSKAQADFKSWAEAGVMRGLLPYSEADLRRASLEAFAALNEAIAQAEAA